jgi:hypothetical protein
VKEREHDLKKCSLSRNSICLSALILTTAAEIEQWMTGRADEALKLQRSLPDGTLKIVASGEKEDKAA